MVSPLFGISTSSLGTNKQRGRAALSLFRRRPTLNGGADVGSLPAFEMTGRPLSRCRQLSGALDQPKLLQRGDAVVEPDFLGDLAVLQL